MTDGTRKVLDHGYLRLVERWGSDERIIESARMSTAKGFVGWGETCLECGWLKDAGDHEAGCSRPEQWKPGDEKLLRFLWEHKHTTPFEMAGATFEVQAPIMVFREWHRHRTQSYSEQSARYVEMPELFYVPSYERLSRGGQAAKNKQASGAELGNDAVAWSREAIREQSTGAFATYRALLERGVAREIARLVLPVNTYSRMRASANLLNWLRFLALRLPENAQWEIRQFAGALRDALTDSFPRTLELFEVSRG